MGFVLWFLRRFGFSVSIPLPSFYTTTKEEMKQSDPSEFDGENIPDVAVSRDYKHAHPELIKRFIPLATEFAEQNPGKSLIVTCTFRGQREQARLYSLGRVGHNVVDGAKVVTHCDGKIKKSDHNHFPARAIDVAVCIGGKITWDDSHYWPIGVLAKKHNLGWGGFWTKFPDYPHLYLPKEAANA